MAAGWVVVAALLLAGAQAPPPRDTSQKTATARKTHHAPYVR